MHLSIMLFNALVSCVFVTTTAHITNGIFRISNVQTQSSLWCSTPRAPCYASRNSSSALLDLYKLWFLTEIPKSPPGIYTLKYLGLDTFAAVHGDNADLIVAGPEQSAFRIEEEGGHYIISTVSREVLWTAEQPVAPQVDWIVKLRKANGKQTQHWHVESVSTQCGYQSP